MKRMFFKTAFVLSVVALSPFLVFPAIAALDALLPARPGPDGLYRNRDLGVVMMVPIFGSLWVVDRIVAALFRAARISGNRWSIFRPTRTWALPDNPPDPK